MKNIVVIGSGYLAKYLQPCMKKDLGEGWEQHVWGIKGSEKNLQEVQEGFAYPLEVQHTLETLEKRKPDLILLAPKPEQVAVVVKESILPYLELCEKEGRPFPDVYNFAPHPEVMWMQKTLGPKVNVANLLPSMIPSVAGIDTTELGVSFYSFQEHHFWPKENRDRAANFLKPTGQVVEMPGELAVSFLAGNVASHCVYDFAFLSGIPLTDAASYMRACLRARRAEFDLPELAPCRGEGVDSATGEYLNLLIHQWFLGVTEYMISMGIEKRAAERKVLGTMELHLLTVQLEPEEKILQNTKNHATKGGVLERCLESFRERAEEPLTALRNLGQDGITQEAADQVRAIAFAVTKDIDERGHVLGKL